MTTQRHHPSFGQGHVKSCQVSFASEGSDKFAVSSFDVVHNKKARINRALNH